MEAPEFTPPTMPEGHRRVAVLLEYDGTHYQGIQRQDHTTETVQHAVEQAALRLGSADPGFIVSGRTDSGVHATGQVVALNLPARLEDRRLAMALNAHLARDIRVRRAVTCAPGFHPRFDARRRTYVYRFIAGEEPPPLLRHFVAHSKNPVEPGLLIAAAEAFVGFWEMQQWRSSHCQGTRTRLHIDDCRADPPRTAGDNERPYWQVTVAARSFLHHQVRFMIGGMLAVGTGRLALGELREALADGRRPGIARKEPACGLCLARIEFAPGTDPFAEGTAP